jgi:hypothetical protein
VLCHFTIHLVKLIKGGWLVRYLLWDWLVFSVLRTGGATSILNLLVVGLNYCLLLVVLLDGIDTRLNTNILIYWLYLLILITWYGSLLGLIILLIIVYYIRWISILADLCWNCARNRDLCWLLHLERSHLWAKKSRLMRYSSLYRLFILKHYCLWLLWLHLLNRILLLQLLSNDHSLGILRLVEGGVTCRFGLRFVRWNVRSR